MLVLVFSFYGDWFPHWTSYFHSEWNTSQYSFQERLALSWMKLKNTFTNNIHPKGVKIILNIWITLKWIIAVNQWRNMFVFYLFLKCSLWKWSNLVCPSDCLNWNTSLQGIQCKFFSRKQDYWWNKIVLSIFNLNKRKFDHDDWRHVFFGGSHQNFF